MVQGGYWPPWSPDIDRAASAHSMAGAAVRVVTAMDAHRLESQFRNPALLAEALTHRSHARGRQQPNNERLEFLGDAILGQVVCRWLYEEFPEMPEGEMAMRKSVIVSEQSLAEAAKRIGLDAMVVLSKEFEAAGGRNRFSVLSDAFEAVTAAIHLDRGLRASRSFVLRALAPTLAEVHDPDYRKDFKSLLMERCQVGGGEAPRYQTIGVSGADHQRTFEVVALVQGTVMGTGTGASKKQAEQIAAREALAAICREAG